jgi:hypothetical protein
MGDTTDIEFQGQTPKTEHILIDYENVQPTDLGLIESGSFRVKVFVGPKQPHIPKDVVIAMQKLGGSFVDVTTVGKNAVDFHIAYYLGAIACSEPEACLHVISKDTGFDPLIQHLQDGGRYARRSECIGEIPSVKATKKRKRKKLLEDAIAFLTGMELNKRPSTLEGLQNSLRAGCKLDEQGLDEIINSLRCRRLFAEKDAKLEYPPQLPPE